MKASEVLEQYAAGERNFQGLNLRGQSFKGKNLAGADFSEADLRSTNFNKANLTGANFTGAKCGLQKRWAATLTILSWLLAAISGFFSFFAAVVVLLIFTFELKNQITGWMGLLVLIIFLIVAVRRGIIAAVTTTVGAVVAVGAAAVVTTAGEALGAAVVISIAGSVAVLIAGAAVATAVLIAVAAAVVAVLIAAATAVLIAVETAAIAGVAAAVVLIAGATAAGAATVLIAVAAYIGWRAMRGDDRDAWIRSFAIAFAAIGGTSFRGADLTNANFSAAKLKSTDMRGATLTRIRWHGAKMLDRIRPGNSYLQTTQVRQWLIGKGIDKNFDSQKLQGINFQGADLTDASFIDANLNEANLQDADLSRAKLVQTQLDRTDFTGVTLTGAFIEDWGITSNTKLDRVRCEYVFMRLPTTENPEPRRKPDNRGEVFEGNDFADFIKPIFDTLDLYHNQGVDPRAIAISWKQLAENHPDAKLQFASMEVKGEDNFLLRLKTAPNADLSQLSAEYFETYNQLKTLAEAKYKQVIAEKDSRIQALANMVDTALKRPGFYAENYNHQGDNEMTGEKTSGDKYEQSGNFGIGHMSGGEIQKGAKVGGVINEAEQTNLADAAKEIQQLLEQLSQTYPTNSIKERNAVAIEAVDRLENNPTLKAKVVNALKAGGIEAFKEAVDHPLVNIFVALIEGWQETE